MSKRIALLCSGGDAPGMNAAVRAVVRTAIGRGWEVLGIERGYKGLIEQAFCMLTLRSVSGIIHRGGTVLKTSRSRRFRTPEGLEVAAETLRSRGIDALIAIGGNGTARGAIELGRIWPGQILLLPGTIDNDLNGTDYTIGYDTAVNVALEAIDRLRDTAESLERTFVVEVMGRDSGFNALDVALAAGAELVLVPEAPMPLQQAYEAIRTAHERGKTSCIVVVAEGHPLGDGRAVAEYFAQQDGPENYRLCVLGHIQRGGPPTARDRLLATRLGGYAVEALAEGATGMLVGEIHGRCQLTPLHEAVQVKKSPQIELLQLLAATAL